MEFGILVNLVLKYGPMIGRFLWDKVNADQDNRIEILKEFNKKRGIEETLFKIYGSMFSQMLKEAKETKRLNFQSRITEYIDLQINKNLSFEQKIDLLKVELAENLERLEQNNPDEMINNAKTIFAKWSKKYAKVLNPSDEDIKKLADYSKILTNDKMTGKDLFKYLKPILGVTSALSLIFAAMLWAGIGMGVLYQVSIFLLGVPVVQIGSAVIVASITGYLALIPINDKFKIQVVIDGIYNILDDSNQNLEFILKEIRDNAD